MVVLEIVLFTAYCELVLHSQQAAKTVRYTQGKLTSLLMLSRVGSYHGHRRTWFRTSRQRCALCGACVDVALLPIGSHDPGSSWLHHHRSQRIVACERAG